jgi:hypothetical protein
MSTLYGNVFLVHMEMEMIMLRTSQVCLDTALSMVLRYQEASSLGNIALGHIYDDF